jgi:hypothetical protein
VPPTFDTVSHHTIGLDNSAEPLMGWLPRKSLFCCDANPGLTPEITRQLIHHFRA